LVAAPRGVFFAGPDDFAGRAGRRSALFVGAAAALALPEARPSPVLFALPELFSAMVR
jgi:hypothetical protein